MDVSRSTFGVFRKQAVAKGTQNAHYAYKSMLYELDVEDVNPLKCSFILSHFLAGEFSAKSLRTSNNFSSFHYFSQSSPCRTATRHPVRNLRGLTIEGPESLMLITLSFSDNARYAKNKGPPYTMEKIQIVFSVIKLGLCFRTRPS